jgi:hypothetical protein
MGLEPTNLLTASQALYQLSYAPVGGSNPSTRRSETLESDRQLCALASTASTAAILQPE